MKALLIALTVVATALAGCANYTEPQAPPAEMTLSQQNFENLWQASRDVLSQYYFTLDRQDRRAGLLVTEPMTGEHFGEFWRKDAATGSDLAESTIQTLYRQATITIAPTSPDGSDYQPVVEVQVYRSNRPQNQITSTSQALRLFRLPGSDRRYSEAATEEEQAQYMVPLGRDEGLEQKLAADIRQAAGKF